MILLCLEDKENVLGVVMLAFSVMFWYLDSFFLATERNYRKIYGWVLQEREKGSRELLYELNFKEFESKESMKGTAIWETAFSKTLKWFYGIPTVISIAYLVVQLIQYCPCKGV